ncbi:hypothetical protein F2P56_017774 [Juglans regia]|uniref:ATP-dependent DNA ligase family profile domain-containing protein n=1 Tax=Juglans regia TaxID=51240 RepID=A0A833UVG2_JUGRE|nr:hypothetical protein F2P56_017774 [Juglans regia]
MQLCYVAFDILYVGDTSVIHQSLKERHELLQKVVKPLKGRLEILVPNVGLGLNILRPSGEPCWSLIAHNVDDVERFFKETIENRCGFGDRWISWMRFCISTARFSVYGGAEQDVAGYC